MKKFFITLLMMLVVSSVAFAAINTSTITQTGGTNVADVTQTGTNNADVDQTGDGNSATIEQVGNNTPNLPGNWWYLGADIDQIGDGNSATMNELTSPNETRIYQFGDNNIASQTTGSNQHKTNNPDRLGLHIKQTGDGNTALQETSSGFGCFGIQGMLVDQFGNSNYADQYSKGGKGSIIEVFHVGSGNSSTQYQWARFSDAHVYIEGNDNTTNQSQTYTVWSISGDDDAYIDIFGDGNDASQTQLGEYNLADIDINGNLNIGSTSTTGDSNDAIVDIDANSNGFTISQNGGNLNYALIDIDSDGNTAMINQDGMSNDAQILMY